MDKPSSQAAALSDIVRHAGEMAIASRRNLVSELKKDNSIVTNADRDVEVYLRAELQKFIPGSSIWGEEFGHDGDSEAGIWLVDPVDGTSNFSFGSPLWGVSVAFLKAGKLEYGAIALPDLHEQYVAQLGQGAFLNGAPIKPIPPGPIQNHELVSYGDNLLRTFPDAHIPGKQRLSGAFVIDGTFTALQRFRGLAGFRERLYDVAASVLIGTEVGADVRYADGSDFDLQALNKPIKIEKPWLMFPQDSGFFYSG